MTDTFIFLNVDTTKSSCRKIVLFTSHWPTATKTAQKFSIKPFKFLSVSRSVVSDSFQPHALQPARFLCPLILQYSSEHWNGLPCPHPGIFQTQGSNPGLPHCRRILYQLSHQGSQYMKGIRPSWVYFRNARFISHGGLSIICWRIKRGKRWFCDKIQHQFLIKTATTITFSHLGINGSFLNLVKK